MSWKDDIVTMVEQNSRIAKLLQVLQGQTAINSKRIEAMRVLLDGQIKNQSRAADRMADRRRTARGEQSAASVPVAFQSVGFHLRRFVATRRHRRRSLLAPDRLARRHGADRPDECDGRRPGRHERRRSIVGRRGAWAGEGPATDRKHARRGGADRPRGRRKRGSI